MTKSLFAFVFFATGWGSAEGGINAVNFDLCNSMGDKSEEKHSDIYCIFSGTEPLDQEKTKANKHKVILHHVNEKDFNACNFDAVIPQILEKKYERIYWVGHDTISGKQALECKDKYGGKTALFHHMHYHAYYGVAKSADICNQKDRKQRDIFVKADYAIAIGPHLYDSLIKNLVVGAKHSPKCGKIIPGIADIEPIKENITNPMTVLFTGRLEEENDPVKQYTVPLFAVSDLVREYHYTTDDITITLIGLKGENISVQAEDFKSQAKNRAGRKVNVLSLQYTTSREELFDIVKRSMVTVMPSISEGFGLAGYESIAAGVPTIISQNSGLYKFLKDIGLEEFVYGIDVTGDQDQDIQTVKEFIHSIVAFLPASKKKAIELRDKLLKLGYTWEKTAEDTYSFLLDEISELSLSLKEMISDNACQFLEEKVADDYVLAAANNHIDRFTEEFKVDKQIVLSTSIDKLYSVKNGYNIEINYRLIFDFIKLFLEDIVGALKKNNASNDILINFTNNNCKALANEPEENVDFRNEDVTAAIEKAFKKNFKKETRKIITSLKINAVITEDDEEVLKNYHNKLLAKPEYDTIDFRGVAVVISEDPTQSKVKLKDIYVPIKLKEYGFSARGGKQHPIYFFENCDRLIIVGDPGSGKSTYLKNKLLDFCVSNSKRMCVFIKVSDFVKQIDVAAELENENLLEKYIEAILKEMSVMEIYTKLKGTGGVDYFIDGLDEVQDSKKKENVNRAIIEFIGRSNDCKFFITSRKIGLDVQPFKTLDFEVGETASLSSESIMMYIEKWYTFISRINNKDYKDNIEKLKVAIDQDKALLTLATNPLLLSIIAILHYHGKRLPNNKAALYKTITETLLQTWMEHRNFTVLKGLHKLDNQDLTNVFSRAAYWMIENKYGEMAIGEGRFGTIYEDYCKEKKRGIKTPAKRRLLEYISQDAGIVVDGGKDDGESLYQFLMHRQFAEYYAAMELDHKLSENDGKLVDKLEKVLDEPKWTEVSILMCDHLHASGESGDSKVQNYITKLFEIKSKPVVDFYTNIQLILKWIINGVSLNEEILYQLFSSLNIIFCSPNRFRVIQFSEDIVNAFADSTNTWYQEEFCNFIKCLLDSDDETAIRNVAVVLNLLLKNNKLYKGLLRDITEERILKALKLIIEKRDFYMLVGEDGCYRTLFIEKFVPCLNYYFNSAENKNVWVDYTASYAFEKKFSVKDKKKIEEQLLEAEAKKFKDNVVHDEFVHSIIFWSFAIEIAENCNEYDTVNSWINEDKWDCKALINSAIEIGKLNTNYTEIGEICTNYTNSNIRLYHAKHNKEHIFTVLLYNRDNKIIERHQIKLPYNFSLDYLREQIEKENIQSYLYEYNFLDQLKKTEMSKAELKELFDQSYATGRLLSGDPWNQLVIDKIAEDGEVFYKYFTLIKREIGPYERLDISGLKNECLIYFKYLFSQRINRLFLSLSTDEDITNSETIEGVKIKDKEQIISLYNNTEDEKHKTVLYEILYNLRNIE